MLEPRDCRSSARAAPEISVVVPVRDGGEPFERSLEAVARSEGVTWELIVADDGSTDGSGGRARQHGATVVETPPGSSGPATARNLGASIARGSLLFFLDADVQVRPHTLAQTAKLFREDPGLVAAFGSYDADPAARDFFSQYRNLLHHFVHQTGRETASTFWAGCGAIRREAFVAAGGFDPTYRRPSIEDIELGYRLVAAGGRIRLAKHVQVTHLKRWTFWGILKTDILDRALPWTLLIARSGRLPNDLNLDWRSRLSALAVYLLAATLVLTRGAIRPAASISLVVLLLSLNRGLYAFLLRERGAWFAARAAMMHWLYCAYSSLVFAAAMQVARMFPTVGTRPSARRRA